MDCETCQEKRKALEPVPFVMHEADMARMERSNKRLWIMCIVLAVLLALSWVGFAAYESQFTDEVTETVETSTDGGGNAYGTIVSGDNSEVHYGESQGNQN